MANPIGNLERDEQQGKPTKYVGNIDLRHIEGEIRFIGIDKRIPKDPTHKVEFRDLKRGKPIQIGVAWQNKMKTGGECFNGVIDNDEYVNKEIWFSVFPDPMELQPKETKIDKPIYFTISKEKKKVANVEAAAPEAATAGDGWE